MHERQCYTQRQLCQYLGRYEEEEEQQESTYESTIFDLFEKQIKPQRVNRSPSTFPLPIMPCYELMLIATEAVRPPLILTPVQKEAARAVLKSSVLQILDGGGVVREVRAFGNAVPLAYKMKRHQIIHTTGRHLAMTFDSSPATMESLHKSLGYDERIIRQTFLRKGEKISQISVVESLKMTRNIHQ
jgi:ribosomal protein S6